MSKPSLTIVMPCYNEEEVLPITINKMTEKVNQLIQQGKISENSYMLFIDDGSKDQTWKMIEAYSQKTPLLVKGLKLSRNVGHQNALLAGLKAVQTELSISIDVDLQDDINAIDEMIEAYHQGYEVVYGVRNDRQSDSFFKRATANSFYQIMGTMGVEQIPNHADFRLLSRKPLKALSLFGEQNVYLRGIIPLLGFSSSKVYYSRLPRPAGETKYPLKKMISLALQGITSFSTIPLRIISIIGLIVSLCSVIIMIWLFFEKFYGDPATGWSSLMFSLYFLCGIQLLSLGIIGEYIGKIYFETKKRPRFIVEKSLNINTEEQN